MKRMNRNIKNLNNIETHDVKLSDGKYIRILRDKETNDIELIVDHDILSKCNQGVKSARRLEQEVQPYVYVEGFYNG